MTLRAEADGVAPTKRRLHAPLTGPFARYSRFVGVMKVLLPSLAALLLGLVVIWPKLSLEDKRFQISFAKLPSKEVESLAMQNARYFGLDESNRPFAVTSDQAIQIPGNRDLIHLQAPKADFTSTSGANIVVDAAAGIYHQTSKTLDLSGGVNLFHDAGYEIHTPTATIDLSRNSARGVEPVEGHGPQGRIEAAGFELSGKGHDITFTGKAHLTLRGASPKGQGQGAKRR
ncbi:MAG: LPS export ABC transporter periplasmic protein LptC [Phaeospirillum sp.]|nr:LPS export ABC transporter periplasmic protein LptC [Phaeospirillum sp.]